jgi:hypothetical protein
MTELSLKLQTLKEREDQLLLLEQQLKTYQTSVKYYFGV